MPVPSWLGNTIGTLGAPSGVAGNTLQNLGAQPASFADRFGAAYGNPPAQPPFGGGAVPWAFGPGGPGVGQAGPGPGPMAGWGANLGAAPAAPGGVGYTNPESAGQGAATDPVGRDWGKTIADFLANFDFKPGAAPKPGTPFAFGPRMAGMAPIGAAQRGVSAFRPPMSPPTTPKY